jgi:5'-3' exoribonuclease 1
VGFSYVSSLQVSKLSADLIVITKDQKKIYTSLKKFVSKNKSKPTATDRWTWPNDLAARDRRFLQELSDDLHLHLTWDETDDYGQNIIVATFNMEGVSEDGEEEEAEGAEEDGEWSDAAEDQQEDEGDVAIQRVLTKYDKAKVVENVDENWEDTYEEKMKVKLEEWKKTYYKVS